MEDNKFLSQEEIDALMRVVREGEGGASSAGEVDASGGGPKNGAEPQTEPQLFQVEAGAAGDEESEPSGETAPPAYEDLTPEEKDALGEIGNISMGSSATTLSQLLNQKVLITSPRVKTLTQKELFESFDTPYMFILVEFTEGITGATVLIMRLRDAMVLADLMMGGDGSSVMDVAEIGEMEISAAAEAMNQMIGTASTSLADVFRRRVNIAPPQTTVVRDVATASVSLPMEDPVVVVSFRMTVGELLDTNIMQIMPLATAREQAALLLSSLMTGEETVEPAVQPAAEGAGPLEDRSAGYETARGDEKPGAAGEREEDRGRYFEDDLEELAGIDRQKLKMLLDIPLRVTVVLGRTRRQLREVMGFTPGAVVELESLVDEPVEILVNGKLVARGEVVVVNENFGVRVTDIITPGERLRNLNYHS